MMPKEFDVKEFGLAVPFESDAALLSPLFDALHEAIRQAHWESLHCLHILSGVETDDRCGHCSWSYRLSNFWASVAFWAGEHCDFCGLVMYECGQACEGWEDY